VGVSLGLDYFRSFLAAFSALAPPRPTPFLPPERMLYTRRSWPPTSSYEGFERGLEALYREGSVSRKAYPGTLLTLRRGIGVEKSYVGWCEEAARITSGS